MMKILGIINKDSAVAYHRITLPLIRMPDVDVLVTNNITEETFNQGFDVVFYSRVTNDYAFDKINEMRAKYGFKLFVDVDDFWELDYWHPMREEYQKDDFHQYQVKHLINADGIFVTNERLLNEVTNYNKQVYIIPNAIPNCDQFAETVRKPTFEPNGEISKRIKLFWQGSITHEADIDLIKYAIENIANTLNDDVEMIMTGYWDDDPIWLRMAFAYTKKGKLKHSLIKAAPYDGYYRAYAYADVCLVPLKNSRFNGMKSNLKILEAASMALPVIAHNVHPYKDLPVMYANGTEQWTRAIKYYVRNENARKEDGLKLKEFCMIHYNHAFINELRKQIFEYESGKQTNTRCSRALL